MNIKRFVLTCNLGVHQLFFLTAYTLEVSFITRLFICPIYLSFIQIRFEYWKKKPLDKNDEYRTFLHWYRQMANLIKE
jgi:hypothetical protein